jgi:tetratricopeptide (TPR) repeat protein
MTMGDMDAALADVTRAATVARACGDLTSEASALSWAANAQIYLHEFDAAEDTLARARKLAEQSASDDAKFSVDVIEALLRAIVSGSTGAAPYLAAAATRHAHATDEFMIGNYLTSSVFFADYWTGRFAEAVREFERIRPAVEALRSNSWVVAHSWEQGLAVAHCGQYERALALFDSLLVQADRIGDVLYPPRAFNSIAWVYGELQDHDTAIRWNEKSAMAGRELGLPDPEIECNAVLNLADSLIALGRLDEADQQFAFVGRVVNDPTPPERWALWRYSQHYFHSFGELHLLRGDAGATIMLAEKCLRMAEETDSRKNIVKARRLRGQAWMALGDLAQAEEDIGAALELAIEIGNPGQLWKTHEAMGDLRRAQGRADEAGAASRDALAILDGIAASLTNEGLRSTLLGSKAVRRLRELALGS